MLEFVYGHDEEIARFVARSVPTGTDFGRCKTIGVIDADGKLIAGLVYFNYDPRRCHDGIRRCLDHTTLVQSRNLSPHV